MPLISVKIDQSIETKKYLQRLLQEQLYPGLQYIAADKKQILFEFAGGFRDIRNAKQMNLNTVLPVYSTTKIVTAIAILQLQEKKKIRLDDLVALYLKEIPYKTITIRQLLSHSAGVPNPILGNFYIHWEEQRKTFNRNALLAKVIEKHNKLKFKPGREIMYSNLGFALLGRVIEVVSGISYEEYINRNIFEKLSLNKNQIYFDKINSDNRAKPYFRKYSIYFNLLARFIRGSRLQTEGNWKSITRRWYMNFPAHGGIIANAPQFIRIFQDLLKDKPKLLSIESKKLLFTPQKRWKKITTAIGWFIRDWEGTKYFYHRGSGIGYCAEVRVYPEKGLVTFLVYNGSNAKKLSLLNELDNNW